MYDSHAYPAYAPEPGSRRIPRPVGDRRLGVAAALAGVLVCWLALSALLPDLGHTLRLALADLSAEVPLTPVQGSPDPEALAAIARQRLEVAGLLAEVAVSPERALVRVHRDDEAEARRWVLPQGNLQLLIVSDLDPETRKDQVRRILELKEHGHYDPLRENLDALPHPYESYHVLLERPLTLPPDWIGSLEVGANDAGQPVLEISLSAAGFTMVKTLELQAQSRDVAAVLDGKLLSLNRTRTHRIFPSLTLDPGPAAWDPPALQRMLTLIRTRLPVALRDAP